MARATRRTVARRGAENAEEAHSRSEESDTAEVDEDWLSSATGGETLPPAAHQAATALGQSATLSKAADIVRLALFTEYRRAPLRRDDIMKKSVLWRQSHLPSHWQGCESRDAGDFRMRAAHAALHVCFRAG